MDYFDAAVATALALVLGAMFALSLRHQIRLQQLAIANATDTRASLFQRVTFAGLSFAILAATVLVAKYANGLTNVAFMLIFFACAVGTLLVVFARKPKA